MCLRSSNQPVTGPNQHTGLLTLRIWCKTRWGKRRGSMAIPQEALLVIDLEAVEVEGLLGAGLHAGEAQAHIDTGVQVLQRELVHPGQEALAETLHQAAVHLGDVLRKRTGHVRSQGQATSKELPFPHQGLLLGRHVPTPPPPEHALLVWGNLAIKKGRAVKGAKQASPNSGWCGPGKGGGRSRTEEAGCQATTPPIRNDRETGGQAAWCAPRAPRLTPSGPHTSPLMKVLSALLCTLTSVQPLPLGKAPGLSRWLCSHLGLLPTSGLQVTAGLRSVLCALSRDVSRRPLPKGLPSECLPGLLSLPWPHLFRFGSYHLTSVFSKS